MEKLKNGEKFGKLAKELSIDSGSAKKDGNLGYFTKGMMVKPFEDAAFKLQIGEVSEPVNQNSDIIIKKIWIKVTDMAVLTERTIDEILEYLEKSINNLAKDAFENLEVSGGFDGTVNFLENQFEN